MKLLMFSLYDTKASFFSPPWFAHHRGIAIRSVMDLSQDLNTTVARYPNDYVLYELGEWDDQTGVATPLAPTSLGPVSGFLAAPVRSSENV